MNKILVVEDEAELATYLVNGLSDAGYCVTHLSEGPPALTAACLGNWQLIIVDRMLPGDFDGLSIVAALRKENSHTPVLALSALASLGEKVRGLQVGCDDYLTKPFALAELLARVEALIRRATVSQETQILRIADLSIDLKTRKAERNGKNIALQPREFRLLEYLLRNQGQIVTRTMLLQAVWDIRFDPGTNVIDVQISRLRNKIDKDFRPPLLHTVRGAGYRFGVDE